MSRAWGIWVGRVAVFALILLSATAAATVNVIGSLDHYYTALPGETIEGQIWVENTLDEAAIVRVEVTDYFVNRWGQAQYPKPSSHDRSLARYIQMMPPEQTIAPQARGVINFQVKLPTLEDHPELVGAYWAVLLVQPSSVNEKVIEPELNEWVITERFQTAVRITTSVAGPASSQLEYESPNLTWPSSPSQSPVNEPVFEVDLVNTGDQLLDLQVVGELIGPDGESLGQTPLSRLRIYPGHRRRMEWALGLEGSWPDLMPQELWLIAHPEKYSQQAKRFGARFVLNSQ